MNKQQCSLGNELNPSSSNQQRIIIGYAIVIVLGGIAGYIAANSLFSLIMSLITGSLLILSAFLVQRMPIVGLTLTYFLILCMSCFFGYRWWMTHKIFPGAVFTFVSLAVLLLICFTQAFEEKRPPSQRI